MIERKLNERKGDKLVLSLAEKLDKNSKELLDIKSSVNSINQTLQEKILYLLTKHDNVLYGNDGDAGLCGKLSKIKGDIKSTQFNVKLIWGFVCAIIVKILSEYFT